MNITTESLARSSGKHPWWVLLAWLFVLAGAFVLSSTLVESALDGEGGPTQTLDIHVNSVVEVIGGRYLLGPFEERYRLFQTDFRINLWHTKTLPLYKNIKGHAPQI